MDAYLSNRQNSGNSFDPPPILIAADSESGKARASQTIAMAGLRVADAVGIEQARERIGQQAAASALWIELETDAGAPKTKIGPHRPAHPELVEGPETHFFTVPCMYRISVAMSSVFYRIGYFVRGYSPSCIHARGPRGGEKEQNMFVSRLAAVAALSLTFGSPAVAQPAAVTIAVWSFNFSPKPIHLAAGKPVTLTFVNRSGSGHDFTAKKFFASSRILSGAAPNGEIELAGHQTRSITLIPSAGTYNAHCSHFLHKQMGMQDLIVVD